jgi:hypothetical protein
VRFFDGGGRASDAPFDGTAETNMVSVQMNIVLAVPTSMREQYGSQQATF